MSVVTQVTLTILREAYRATGSLAAAAAILRREFRAPPAAQARDVATRILGAAPSPADDPQPPQSGDHF